MTWDKFGYWVANVLLNIVFFITIPVGFWYWVFTGTQYPLLFVITICSYVYIVISVVVYQAKMDYDIQKEAFVCSYYKC
jgi:hypothetical protein